MDNPTRTPDYAGIGVNDNAAALAIGLVDSWYQVVAFGTDMPEIVSNGVNGSNHIVVGDTGDYLVGWSCSGESAAANKTFEWTVFEVAATGSTITSSTNADPVVVTATAHGFSDADKVKISGVTTQVELNNRIFTVADKADNTFEITDDGGASPANDIDGTGHAGAGTGGTAYLVTETACHSHRKFSAGGAADVGSFGDSCILSLTKNNTIELHVKGVTDATNFIHEQLSFWITRLK